MKSHRVGPEYLSAMRMDKSRSRLVASTYSSRIPKIHVYGHLITRRRLMHYKHPRVAVIKTWSHGLRIRLQHHYYRNGEHHDTITLQYYKLGKFIIHSHNDMTPSSTGINVTWSGNLRSSIDQDGLVARGTLGTLFCLYITRALTFPINAVIAWY